jgi:fibronectin type 3 domain-containing protein
MRRYLWYLALLLALAWPAIAQTAQHSIKLTWTAGTGDVTYNVYRSTVAGGPYSKLTTTPISVATYTDTTGTGGTKYFYVTTGLDASGVESINSNEASATFLLAPGAPTALAAVQQ